MKSRYISSYVLENVPWHLFALTAAVICEFLEISCLGGDSTVPHGATFQLVTGKVIVDAVNSCSVGEYFNMVLKTQKL